MGSDWCQWCHFFIYLIFLPHGVTKALLTDWAECHDRYSSNTQQSESSPFLLNIWTSIKKLKGHKIEWHLAAVSDQAKKCVTLILCVKQSYYY